MTVTLTDLLHHATQLEATVRRDILPFARWATAFLARHGKQNAGNKSLWQAIPEAVEELERELEEHRWRNEDNRARALECD